MPVKRETGDTGAVFVTGWTYRYFARHLQESLKDRLTDEAKKTGNEGKIPVFYVAVFDKTGVYSAPLTPPVDEKALAEQSLVDKTAQRVRRRARSTSPIARSAGPPSARRSWRRTRASSSCEASCEARGDRRGLAGLRVRRRRQHARRPGRRRPRAGRRRTRPDGAAAKRRSLLGRRARRRRRRRRERARTRTTPPARLVAYASGYGPDIQWLSVDRFDRGPRRASGASPRSAPRPRFSPSTAPSKHLYAVDENTPGQVGAYSIDPADRRAHLPERGLLRGRRAALRRGRPAGQVGASSRTTRAAASPCSPSRPTARSARRSTRSPWAPRRT